MGFEETIGIEETDISAEGRNDDGNPYVSPQVNDILERPFKIGTFTWSSATALGSQLLFLDLIRTWLGFDYPAKVLSKFHYFACDLRIRIQLQTTMMHYGKLAIAWLPMADLANTNLLLGDLFALDAHILDAANPQVIEFTIPFMYCLKWWNTADFLQPTLGAMARGPGLMVRVLAPLGNAQAATASAPFSIYINAENVRVAGPVANALNGFQTPSFFQSSTSGQGKRLAERGFVRAVTDSVPSFVSVRQFASPGQSLEDDTTVRLSLKADTTMDYTKSMVQAILPDEHNLLNVCKRPYLLDSFVLTGSSTGPVWTAPVCPDYVAGPTNAKRVAANAQVVCRLAEYWHGSMKYLFAFTAAHVTTIRVAVVLSYEGSNPNTTDDRVAAVWDITGSMNKTLEVPFLSNFPYIPVTTTAPELVKATYYGLPTINIIVINPLTSGSVSTVTPSIVVNVFASVGEDFRLFLPRGFDANFRAFTNQSYLQDNLSSLFAQPFESLGDDGTNVVIPEYNFHEELIDILDILTRYTRVTTIAAPTTFTRNIPIAYRGFYRFSRYGNRFKTWLPAQAASAVYQNRLDTAGYTSPPFDVVPSPQLASVQVELPYYEPWYFDLPTTMATSQVVISPSSTTNEVYSSLSGDSVLSFWTWSVQWNASSFLDGTESQKSSKNDPFDLASSSAHFVPEK